MSSSASAAESGIPADHPLRIVLMGTGPFAVPSFEAIRRAGHTILLVVTRPQSPVKSRKGPPPAPVRQWASERELPIADPPSINEEEAIELLRQAQPDLLVVCDYGQILGPAALKVAPLGGINLHGSLLPAYRGAAPVQRALLAGEPETGVSVIHMTPKLDAGPILATRSTPIRDTETAGELEARLAELGVPATLEAIDRLRHWDGASPLGETQDKAKATKAPRLSKSEAEIDWGASSRQIDCHVRGMQPWPVAFTHASIEGRDETLRLAIREVRPLSSEVSSQASPGQLVPGEGMVVATGDGAVEVLRVQPAGRREMSGEAFLRGHLQSGTTLQLGPAAPAR